MPWGTSAPLAPVTLTSNQGSTATFTFKNCRNGWTYNGPRSTLLGDGNGNMMDGHVNSTLDGPYLFDMEATDIPFAVYDVIFYIGANKDQFGDGTGVINFNGGADRAFTLKPGTFNGTFTEMVNATTQGNYIVFRGVTGASFTTQTWGTGPNGFNHVGPCGFQIREAAIVGDTTTTLMSSPDGTGSYGNAVTFTATVGAFGVPATGRVTFKDGSAVLESSTLDGTGLASFTTSTLTVASHSITATGYALSGANAGNYVLAAQPTVPNASITPRPVQLTGTRTYDGTSSAAGLMISNKVGGDDLTLTGTADLASKDVGARGVVVNFATPTRVQHAKGNTGLNAAATISVSMGVAPAAGNTMIAVIATRGTSANIVSSINQTGVSNGTWVRAAQSNNTSMTTEIWYAPNMPSGAGTAVTINQATFRSAAVVMEYSGVLVASPLDQIAPGHSVGTSTDAVTGTITATTQANELWIGGIGFAHRTRTLGTILNSFTPVDNATSTNTTNSNNARVYALERIVNSTGSASSGGAISSSTQWAGTIATFKAASSSGLALAGTAKENYTLTGLTGSVEITPKALTLTATPAVIAKTYDGLTAATLTGATLRAAQAPGTGTTNDGTPYAGDAVTVVLSGTFDTKDAGSGKAVTSTSTLSGAQKGNYTLTQPVGISGEITPAGLTITVGNQSKTYGQTIVFGSGSTLFASSGLQNRETIGTVTLTCAGGDAAAAVAGSPYTISPSTATGGTFTAANYAISYASGVLTVNPAGQAITFGPLAAKTYGSGPFALTATADSELPVSYVIRINLRLNHLQPASSAWLAKPRCCSLT